MKINNQREKKESVLKFCCDKKGIENISKVINDGGIVVFPTDTVYGIGCDPFNKRSIERLYLIKERPRSKPLPVLVPSMKVALEIVEFDEISKRIAEKFWPGPLTLILKCNNQKLRDSLNVKTKVGVRIPKNECLQDLLNYTKFLVGTSANISGESPFTNSQDCFNKMKGYDAFLDGGNIKTKGESTVLEIRERSPIVHRMGVLKKEEFEEFF